MRYQDKQFTLPTCGKILTTEQYEIAVGLRCHTCRKRLEVCACTPPDVYQSAIPALVLNR